MHCSRSLLGEYSPLGGEKYRIREGVTRAMFSSSSTTGLVSITPSLKCLLRTPNPWKRYSNPLFTFPFYSHYWSTKTNSSTGCGRHSTWNAPPNDGKLSGTSSSPYYRQQSTVLPIKFNVPEDDFNKLLFLCLV